MSARAMLRPAVVLSLALCHGTALAWLQTFTGDPGELEPAFSRARLVAFDGAGDVVAAGVFQSTLGNDQLAFPQQFVTVSKRSLADGAELWRRTFSTIDLQGVEACTNGCQAGGLVVDAGNDVIVGGLLRNSNPFDTGRRMAAVKLHGADGTLAWGWAYLSSLYSHAEQLVADPAGDVVLAGEAIFDSYTTRFEFFVVKLAQATGTLLWEYRLNGTATPIPDDEAYGVTTDANGDVLATGVLASAGTGIDLVTVKLDGTTGTELWRQVLAAPSSDVGMRIVADSAGDAVVAGAIAGDLGIVKLDGATGAVLWQRPVFDVVSFLSEERPALALGPGDDVLVAGRHDGGGGERFIVSRLAAADGAELWRTSVGGAFGQATALALSDHGTMLATGTLPNPSSGGDLALVEMDLATGAALRTQLVDGPDHDADRGNAIALHTIAIPGGTSQLVALAGALTAGPETDGELGTDFAVAVSSQQLRGRKLSMIGEGATQRFGLRAVDPFLLAPATGSPADPTSGGAALLLRNPGTGEEVTIPLPAANWTAKVGRKVGALVYKYTDRALAAGPCKRVVLASGRKLKVACRGGLGGFTLDEPMQGTMTVRLTTGSGGSAFCFDFDAPRVDQPGRFVAGGTTFALACP